MRVEIWKCVPSKMEDKQILREFIATRFALKPTMNGDLHLST
jgi:hypothetical protein